MKKPPVILRFSAFLLILAIFLLLLFLAVQVLSQNAPAVNAANLRPIVVLDAGHGGEDGGASSTDGALEKDLNLALAFALRDALESRDVQVVLTRDTDTLLYDRNADYQGRKKALDMAARLKITNETPNAVFVSLHMNTYPQASCKGVQVWYSENNAASQELAQSIQSTVKELLQSDNKRVVKRSGDSIYLLRHLQCPAVLVECGFLSNPSEAALLQDETYRRQLADVLCEGILRAIA